MVIVPSQDIDKVEFIGLSGQFRNPMKYDNEMCQKTKSKISMNLKENISDENLETLMASNDQNGFLTFMIKVPLYGYYIGRLEKTFKAFGAWLG